MYKRVHVIINPVSGPDRPILAILNRAFHPAGIDWDVFITKKAGDGRRLAQESAAAGVDAIVVWGGDGSVMEVASGLVDSQIPIAILPGGTGNGLCAELGIPIDPEQACKLITEDNTQIREIDLGDVGDHHFALNAGVGFATDIAEGANREAKDRLGLVAYLLAGLQSLREPPMAHYTLTLDGEVIETDGISCLIANGGALGSTGMKLAPNIDISDGLLDVVVLRSGDIGTLLSVAVSVVTGNENASPLQRWQAREITLVTDPVQNVQLDGDVMGNTPLIAKVIPGAARIIVPAGTGKASSQVEV